MAEPGHPIRVVAYLDDLVKYRDRMLMFREASRELHQLYLFTRTCPTGWELARFTTDHFRILPLGQAGIRAMQLRWQLLRQVEQLLQTQPIEVLHDTGGVLLPVFARLRSRSGSRPVLLSSSFAALYDWYEVVRHRWPYRYPRFLRARWKGLLTERMVARLADAITLFGEDHCAPFARLHGLPPGRVHSLPNCVDPEWFQPVAPVRAATGSLPEEQVLLFTGSIFRHKGCFELVEAFGRIAARYPRARLLLVGTAHPGELPLLQARIAAFGLRDRVLLRGELPRERLPGLLAACHGFVFPSFNEGSPRAVIEAMAAGLPIVATRIAGIRTLDPEERFILFVERGDVEGLAAALSRLLSSPAEARERGEQARHRFLLHHTPAAAAPALTALYRHLLGPNGPRERS